MWWHRQEQPPTWPLPETSSTSSPSPSLAAPQGHPRLRAAVGIALAVVLLLAVALGVAYWRLSATVTSYAGAHFNSGQNAIWLEHTWAGQSHAETDYDQLAQRLSHEQIAFVYAHVGPLQSDGTIPSELAPNAVTLVTALHSRLPHVKVL